jgi:hypothetical protein
LTRLSAAIELGAFEATGGSLRSSQMAAVTADFDLTGDFGWK